MGSVPQPAKSGAKDVGGAFRALLQRTARRVEGGTRSPATLAMQRQHARYFLERIGRATPVAALTPHRIAQLLEQERAGRRRLLSGNTLRKRASTLSQALELARGRAPKLPEIPYEYRPQVTYLRDLAAYERLRDALTPAQRLWFAVAVWTGQRRSDVERMRREDFDPAAPFVVVRSTKTGRRVGVRIHAAAELVRELREHWLRLQPGEKLVPAWPHANTTLRRICAKLDMPHLSTKALRHTFFTWYVAANGFTAELLEIGGWKDLQMPARVYAHALPVRFRSQIDRTFAVAKSLRIGPRKSLAKAKAGTTSRGVVPNEVGRSVLVAPTAPDTRPERRAAGTGWDPRHPPPQQQAAKVPVGPTGIEPVTYGLKVPRPLALSASPEAAAEERRPCLQPPKAPTASP